MKTVLRTCVLFVLMMLIASTADLFGQWVQQPFPSSEYLWRVRFLDENTGWILGHDYIYKTTNGGTTWLEQDPVGGGGITLAIVDPSTVVYANWLGRMRRTTDGGVTWQTVDSSGFLYEDIDFVDSVTGFCVGSNRRNNYVPTVWKTTDGGATWSTVADSLPPAEYEGVGVSLVDPMNGWVLTYDEYLFRTTNGGLTWTHQTSFDPSYRPMSSDDIQFVTADSGWAVGGIAGSIYIARTTDGGVTWSDSTLGGSTRELDFVNSQVGWIVQGLADSPMRTTDGGLTWERQIAGQTPPLQSIDMIDEQTGWIVGGGGTVYKTTNGGVVFVDEEPPDGIPSSFTLEQNYPNPFNPSTLIKYGVPHESHVSLKLYDVLGEEVVTLVDGIIFAGFHEISLDASGLSSGVYYYRLQATDPSSRSVRSGRSFIDTKKLVLLR